MKCQIWILAVTALVVAADSPPTYLYEPPRHAGGSSAETTGSRPVYRVPQDSGENSEEYGPAKYDFEWAVKDDDSGNDFGHQEARDDDHTQGSYYVQLPDGRLQTVKYVVDGDDGYVAEVSYEGEAQYPESHEIREYSSPRRAYSAPELEEEEYREAPDYTPPRPRYTAPESKDRGISRSSYLHATKTPLHRTGIEGRIS
ncbi:uncharacterized protein LOC119596832 [Penaeus monodon]|uniref:uncharacterized protein LOC119596832 n=1 Tax=Penaeus monodon TaxID=6687 RepID=UPI0018A7B08E|nr:uncharacterized protein LOC119596832 [Penaeus monodon]